METESTKKHVCRICIKIKNESSMRKFFENNFSNQFSLITSVTVNEKDQLPKYICKNCANNVSNFVKFRELCISSHSILTKIRDENGKKSLMKRNGNNLKELKNSNKVGSKAKGPLICCNKFFRNNAILLEHQLKAHNKDTLRSPIRVDQEIIKIQDDSVDKINELEELQVENNQYFSQEDSYEKDNVSEKMRNFSIQLEELEIDECTDGSSEQFVKQSRNETTDLIEEFINPDEFVDQSPTDQLVDFQFQDTEISDLINESIEFDNYLGQISNDSYLENTDKGEYSCQLQKFKIDLPKSRSPEEILYEISNTGSTDAKNDEITEQDVDQLNDNFIKFFSHETIVATNHSSTGKHFDLKLIKIKNKSENFKIPLQMIKTSNSIREPTICRNPDSPIKCPICERPVPNMSKLKTHMRTHTGERPYGCPMCSQRFGSISTIRNHIYFKHLITEPYLECDICSKKFKDKKTLRSHIQIHMKRELKCKICSNKYEKLVDLKNHMYEHMDRLPYPCSQCWKSFLFPRNLRDHIRTIHTSNNKSKKATNDHLCSICAKQFKKSYLLNIHLRRHNGEKPYVCKICSQAFRFTTSLQEHMVAKHDDESIRFTCDICQKKFKSKRELIRHIKIHTMPTIVCDICPKKFRDEKHFERHRRSHNGFKQFHCTVCLKGFALRQSLRRHVLVQHNLKDIIGT